MGYVRNIVGLFQRSYSEAHSVSIIYPMVLKYVPVLAAALNASSAQKNLLRFPHSLSVAITCGIVYCGPSSFLGCCCCGIQIEVAIIWICSKPYGTRSMIT